jgi:hypothetical protein
MLKNMPATDDDTDEEAKDAVTTEDKETAKS